MNVNLDDLHVPADPSKPCTVAGCGGTMEYRSARSLADAPHTLEWDWRPTFVCDKDKTHAEVLSPDENEAALREHARRRGEAFAERLRRITVARAERARSKPTPEQNAQQLSLTWRALTPMRLLRLPDPFDHSEFIFEPKIDGLRALAHIRGHLRTGLPQRAHVQAVPASRRGNRARRPRPLRDSRRGNLLP